MMEARRALRQVKLIQTVVWAIFASAILAIPVMVWMSALGWAWVLSALVIVEVAVLMANRMHCPLSGVAARYTDDRSANFDIYLPAWLAKHNKLIFGLLFAVGELFLVLRWFIP